MVTQAPALGNAVTPTGNNPLLLLVQMAQRPRLAQRPVHCAACRAPIPAAVPVCPAGYGRNATCGACAKGAYSAAGTYTNPAPGCRLCPANTTTAGPGANSSAACQPSERLVGRDVGPVPENGGD